jgi:hypothetical protein
MLQRGEIPVIDLFAGPRGLCEGFSSIFDEIGARRFAVKVSIEKDPVAHRTLLLRAIFRKFAIGKVPDCYYEYPPLRKTQITYFLSRGISVLTHQGRVVKDQIVGRNNFRRAAPLQRLHPLARRCFKVRLHQTAKHHTHGLGCEDPD